MLSYWTGGGGIFVSQHIIWSRLLWYYYLILLCVHCEYKITAASPFFLLFLWHSQVSGYALLVFGVLYYVRINSLCAHTPGSYCARVALACGFFFSKKTHCNTRRRLIPRPRYNIIVFCTPRQHTMLSYCYAGLRGRALDVSFECRERTVQ